MRFVGHAFDDGPDPDWPSPGPDRPGPGATRPGAARGAPPARRDRTIPTPAARPSFRAAASMTSIAAAMAAASSQALSRSAAHRRAWRAAPAAAVAAAAPVQPAAPRARRGQQRRRTARRVAAPGSHRAVPGSRIGRIRPIAQPSPTVPSPENRERYAGEEVAAVQAVAETPVSTFSVDVDTGSYANVRRLLNDGPDAAAGARCAPRSCSTISATIIRCRATGRGRSASPPT